MKKNLLSVLIGFTFYYNQAIAQTELWGMTFAGGADNAGAIFKTNSDGTGLSVKYTFAKSSGVYPNGNGPYGSMTQFSNGKFYGLTFTGGTNNFGVLFEFDPATNTFVKKKDLDASTGKGSHSDLFLFDGKLYGVTTDGGANNLGTLFDYDPLTDVLTKRFDFDGNYAVPGAPLVNHSNGKLYGLAGGLSGQGAIYEYDPQTTTVTKKIDFDTNHGLQPAGGLIKGSDGNLWGMAYGGGTNSLGVLFQYDPTSNTLVNKFNFDGAAHGSYPLSNLVQHSNGKFYGMTNTGGVNTTGVLFEFDPSSNTLTKKVDFDNGATNNKGGSPYGSLIESSNSKLYGMNFQAGLYDYGVLFQYDPGTSTFTKVFDFDGTNEGDPYGSLSGNKSIQTITFNSLPSKTYGNTSFSLGATASSALPVSYSSSNPSIASISGNVVTILGAGTVTITARQDGDKSTVAAYAQQTLTINKATLTATAANTSRVYGATNPTFTVNYTGFVGTDNSSVVDTPPTGSTTATQFSNAGTYPITLAGGTDNNYALTLVSGTLTVTKATLTATASNTSKVYGATNPAFTFNYTGFLGTDNSSVIDTPPTGSTTATQFSNTGTYPITLAGGSDNNYSLTYVSGTLTVTKASLTATATNVSRAYGIVNPTFTVNYTGFLGTDNSSVIDTPPSVVTSAVQFSNTGTYAITPFGGTDNNYTLTFVDGTLTVTKAPVTVTATNSSRAYGATDPAFTFNYTGFLGIDNSSVIDTPPTTSTTATQFSNTGTYPITLAGGSDNNYSLTLVSGTLAVTKASIVVTASAASREYGTTNSTFSVFYTGFVGTDNASAIDTPPTGSTAATQFSNAGTYPITLTGGSDNNYTFTLNSGTLTITKALLTATAINVSRVYGTANPSLTISYSGFLGTDNSSVIDTPPTASTTATQFGNASTYPITLTGGSDNNYSIVLTNGNLTVTKATLTVTAVNQSKTYGSIDPAYTFAYSGFLGTDNSSVIDMVPTVSTTTGQFSDVGTYPITLSGGNDNNYALSLGNGTLTITQAPLTISAANAIKTYGAQNISFTYTGFLGSDNAAVIDTPPTISTSATQFSNVGTYPVTLSGGADNNYSITLVNGTLTINKASLTVTAVDQTRAYGAPDPTFSLSYNGLLGLDNASAIDAQPTTSTTATQLSIPGTYPITLTGGSDNNYSLVLVNGVLTITKNDQTITFGTFPSKTLGDAPFALSASASSGLAVSYLTAANKVVINSGVATIVAAGRENITASQAGNVSYNAAIPVSLSFCINPAKPAIAMTNTQASHTLTSSSSTGNQWFFNGTAIVGETNSTLTATQTGVYTVQVTVDDCISQLSDPSSLAVTGLSVQEPVALYPNPSRDFIFITGIMADANECVVTDATGRQSFIVFTKEQDFVTADVRYLSSGVYALKVVSNGEIHIFKFVKQ